MYWRNSEPIENQALHSTTTFEIDVCSPTIFFVGMSFFLALKIYFHGSKNLRPTTVSLFVAWTGICVILPYFRTRSRIVRGGIISRIRGRLRKGTSCASPEGQRTIGLGRCGLEGVPWQ